VTQEPRESAPDPLGDLQRWLLRRGAREVGKGVSNQVKSVFGGNKPNADIWETATAEPSPDAPECAWCPVCRAARLIRSRPGLASQLAATGGNMAAMVQEVANAVEAAIAAASGAAPHGAPGQAAPGQGAPGQGAESQSAWGQAAAGQDAPGQASAAGSTAGNSTGAASTGEPVSDPDDRG
jgi:hypothetical protein